MPQASEETKRTAVAEDGWNLAGTMPPVSGSHQQKKVNKEIYPSSDDDTFVFSVANSDASSMESDDDSFDFDKVPKNST